MSSPTSLVQSSYRLGSALSSKEQIIRLVELCRASALLNGPEPKTKELALALFRIATTDRTGLRPVGQKNAAACLSYVDPVAGMELLSEVNFQRPGPGGWVYEDPRYNAAEAIFANLAKIKPLDISTIAEEARYLGRTGQYPYVAVAKVIHRVPRSLRNQANALLIDALNFYSNETGFYNRDEEFLHFLELLNDSFLDRELVACAVATFVKKLEQNPVHIPGDYYAEIHIASIGKVLPFVDRNEAFLFQVFPQIERLNPVLAAQLRQQDPELGQATDNMSYISGGFVQDYATPEHVARQHFQWLQQALLQRIRECRESNPLAALALSQRLTDLRSRGGIGL